MIIAGLTGDIGHGKTTFAEFLAAQSAKARHLETWELVAEVASSLKSAAPQHPSPNDIEAINEWLQALPKLVQVHMHVEITFEAVRLTPTRLADHPTHYAKLFEYLQEVQRTPKLATDPITLDTKERFRHLLQWVGGYLAITHDGIWYRELIRRTRHLSSQGVELVTISGVRFPRDAEILRNNGGVILEIMRPGQDKRDKNDLTERERELIKADSIIINDGILPDLERCAQSVWKDLTLRDIQAKYLASSFAGPISQPAKK